QQQKIMAKVLVLEDDPFISKTIENLLKEKGFTVIGVSKTVAKASAMLSLNPPDLCLVDIQLKGKETGITFAKKLDELTIPYFYLTAQTDPITLSEVQKTAPLGYITKPFTPAGLWSSISVTWTQYLANQEYIITVKSNGTTYRIAEKDILFLEAFDNYCYIQTTTKKLLIPHTLKHTHQQLESSFFFMPHRSYWINLKKITNVGKRNININNFELPVSEARRSQLLTSLKEIS
ncbi:MAG: LytR/AlgR family response regulator transcription factor, partial [Flavobacteriaceae bacterium]